MVDEARVPFSGIAWGHDDAGHLGSQRDVLAETMPDARGH
jgi:hypothetical protein